MLVRSGAGLGGSRAGDGVAGTRQALVGEDHRQGGQDHRICVAGLGTTDRRWGTLRGTAPCHPI
jgi:hypothetical protein